MSISLSGLRKLWRFAGYDEDGAHVKSRASFFRDRVDGELMRRRIAVLEDRMLTAEMLADIGHCAEAVRDAPLAWPDPDAYASARRVLAWCAAMTPPGICDYQSGHASYSFDPATGETHGVVLDLTAVCDGYVGEEDCA